MTSRPRSGVGVLAALVLLAVAPSAVAAPGDPAPPPLLERLLPSEPEPEPEPEPDAVPDPPLPTPEAAPLWDVSALPDLRLAPVRDVRLVRSAAGELQLRFSSTVLNTGDGPLVIRASRPDRRTPFTVEQRLPMADGTAPMVPIDVGTRYAGDGHAHWHIVRIVAYTLEPLPAPADAGGSAELRRARKVGFCLYDTARYRNRPDAPARAHYPRTGCGTERSTTLRMGLSVGWGDLYFWSLRGQYVDLTGLPAGRYRLTGVANPEGALFESRADNNAAFVDLVLRRGEGGPSLRILDRAERSPNGADPHGHHPSDGSGSARSMAVSRAEATNGLVR